MIAIKRLRKLRPFRASASATTLSTSTNRTAVGSVCVAGRIIPSETKSSRLLPFPELEENPLYYDKDYRGLHRWEVA